LKLSEKPLSIEEHIDTYRSKTSSQILGSARKERQSSPYQEQMNEGKQSLIENEENDYPYVSSAFKPEEYGKSHSPLSKYQKDSSPIKQY